MRRLLFLLPVAVLVVVLFGAGGSSSGGIGSEAQELETDAGGRLVVVVLDSLRRETLEADGVMPELLEMAHQPGAELVDVHTCAANFTYPCLQTMFEGRQSPFVAGLHNFTGRASDGRSVPSDLNAAERAVVILSDISLVSLYGNTAQESVNVEDWPLGHLERDLRAVELLADWLKNPAIDDIFFHLVGTDKAAHQSLPGSEAYNEHFRQVDRALAAVLKTLDFSRDQLIITGDHGHNAQGHHTRESVAIFLGARFEELFGVLAPLEEIEQPELTYLMSYAAALPLPLDYEGRYFLQEHRVEDPAGVDAFTQLTRDTLASAGYQRDDLNQALADLRSDNAGRYLRALWQNLPLLTGFFFWLLLIQSGLSDGRAPARRLSLHAAVALSLLLTWWLSAPYWALSLGLSALYLAAGALWTHRFGGARRAGWLLVLMLITAVISYNAKEWADFFHTRGGFVPSQPIFYAGLPLVGLALAWLRDKDWRRAPEAAMIFGVTCLPSGVYYYQFGQNIFWGFFLSAALVALISLIVGLKSGENIGKNIREKVAPHIAPGTVFIALLLACSAVILLLQEAGGWVWLFFPTRWFLRAPEWVAWAVYAGAAGYASALLKSWPRRVGFALYMLLSAVAAVPVGKMPFEVFVSAQAVLLFMVSLFSLPRASDCSDKARPRNPRLDGLLLWASFLALSWCMFGGFFLHNLDFHFGFEYFGHFQRESAVFAAIGAVTMLKYGLAACAPALFYRLRYGRRAWRAASGWLLFFAALQLLALFVQMNFTALGSSEKLYELAISEGIFVLGILLAAAAFIALDELVGRWRPGGSSPDKFS